MSTEQQIASFRESYTALRAEIGKVIVGQNEIVEGTLNSIEREIEYAIERTARSPMIREAHDYRVGLFDRYWNSPAVYAIGELTTAKLDEVRQDLVFYPVPFDELVKRGAEPR